MHCLLFVSSADVGKNNRANTLIGKPRACVVFISHTHKVWIWLSYCIQAVVVLVLNAVGIKYNWAFIEAQRAAEQSTELQSQLSPGL